MNITFCAVNLFTDRERLVAMDRSFVTDRIFRVSRTPFSFTLEETLVDPPLRKHLPLEDDLGEQRAWDEGLVAESDGEIVGFAAWKHERWNRRTVLWHLYVAPSFRGLGTGRRLSDAVIGDARSARMRCVWLETSSVNYPAITFYRRLGFALCGLDMSLYDPAGPATSETALYFTYPLE